MTAIAVISLGLGIGANSAIFSVINAVLLKPLPQREVERLVMIWGSHQRSGRRYNPSSPPDFVEWRAQNHVFEQIAGSRDNLVTLTGRGDPEQLLGYRISADYLEVMGVQPRLGRNFRPEEDRAGGPRVVILNHRLWQRRFAGDPKILGQSLILNGESHLVIGVMPPGYEDLIGSEVWTPLALTTGDYNNQELRILRLVARLKPGVTIRQAQDEMNALTARQEREDPKPHEGWRVELIPLRDHYFGDISPALKLLSGAVGFVLLIACANISNLLLSKVAARRRESAIRAALGASRFRLIRQLLTEGAILALLGGLLALPLAKLSLRLFLGLFSSHIANVRLPHVERIPIDGRVLGFTLLVSIVSGIILGLIPARQYSRINLNEALKDGNRGAGLPDVPRTYFRYRVNEWTVIAEIALALVLLAGAGLMLKNLLRLSEVKLGFNPKNVLTMRAILPLDLLIPQPEKRRLFYQNLLPRLESLPGIESAGIINFLPLSGWAAYSYFTVEDGPSLPSGEKFSAYGRAVSPNYFRTMGIPMLKGRAFTEYDNEPSPPVIIINETLARRFFGNGDPIGKRLSVPSRYDAPLIPREIVGIIGDVRHDGAENEIQPEIYFPFVQAPSPVLSLVLRTKSDPMSLADAARRQIWAVDKDQPVSYVMTMEQLAAESTAGKRISTLMLGIYAILALAMASIGIYGVMTHAVSQQTREFGIRTALGATSRDVLRLVMWRGLSLVLIGIGIGLAGALALTRVSAYLLYQVSAADPLTLVLVSILLIAIAMIACYIPARRAANLDPLIALRYE